MSTKITMSVLEAMNRKNILRDRIDSIIEDATFVTYVQGNSAKIAGMSVSDYENTMKSELQSVQDLMKELAAIETAIIQSNATTQVTITDGKKSMTMSRAEAIGYKKNIAHYKSALLERLSRQLASAKSACDRKNEALEKEADEFIRNLSANNSKDANADKSILEIRKSYIEPRTSKLVDPCKAETVIKKLSDELDFVLTRVDAAIVASNAQTQIEIEF